MAQYTVHFIPANSLFTLSLRCDILPMKKMELQKDYFAFIAWHLIMNPICLPFHENEVKLMTNKGQHIYPTDIRTGGDQYRRDT